jgi:hypothetical protein
MSVTEASPQFAAAHSPRLPIEPFRDWINARLGEYERRARVEGFGRQSEAVAKAQLAASIDVTTRTIHRYRFESQSVPEGIVDRALSLDARYHLLDLYPDRY